MGLRTRAGPRLAGVSLPDPCATGTGAEKTGKGFLGRTAAQHAVNVAKHASAGPRPRAGRPAPPGALRRDQYSAESSGVTAEVAVRGHLGSRVLNWDSSGGFEYFEYFVCLNFGV